jgi:hypothetical protein
MPAAQRQSSKENDRGENRLKIERSDGKTTLSFWQI